jgi:hypothetical protein
LYLDCGIRHGLFIIIFFGWAVLVNPGELPDVKQASGNMTAQVRGAGGSNGVLQLARMAASSTKNQNGKK